MKRAFIKSAEILKSEQQNNNTAKLIVNLVSVEGSWYVASLTRRSDDSKMESWKISRIKKGKPLSPLHPYKKCHFCDKNHYIGDCQFIDKHKEQELLTELYHNIRLKSLWA